jgi:hypothetical protein
MSRRSHARNTLKFPITVVLIVENVQLRIHGVVYMQQSNAVVLQGFNIFNYSPINPSYILRTNC